MMNTMNLPSDVMQNLTDQKEMQDPMMEMMGCHMAKLDSMISALESLRVTLDNQFKTLSSEMADQKKCMMNTMTEMMKSKPVYKFEVVRDRDGLMTEVNAKPQSNC